MSEPVFGKAIYIVGEEAIHLIYCFGFSDDLIDYITDEKKNILALDGDTHIARFVRGEEDSSGLLRNTMPGSKFTKFEFHKGVIGGITIIVATYT